MEGEVVGEAGVVLADEFAVEAFVAGGPVEGGAEVFGVFEEVGVVAGFGFGEGAEDVGEFAAVPAAGYGEEVVEEVGEGFFLVGVGGIERGSGEGIGRDFRFEILEEAGETPALRDGGHAEA